MEFSVDESRKIGNVAVPVVAVPSHEGGAFLVQSEGYSPRKTELIGFTAVSAADLKALRNGDQEVMSHYVTSDGGVYTLKGGAIFKGSYGRAQAISRAVETPKPEPPEPVFGAGPGWREQLRRYRR